MTSVIRNEAAAEARQNKSQDSSTTSDVQSYLISNYREALKKGDRSAAKSCLLAARYFSVNDPNVTNEIYLMAKSDGDVGEAAKCFANVFSDVFLDNERDLSSEDISHELKSVIHQIKDETKSLLTDLKTQYLRLKSLPVPAALTSRQASSIQTSPMLSPRIRLSSEDRSTARESLAKLDSHLHSSSRTLFYQQLFDSLPDTIKKSILDYSIETCENSIEQCRLMMLAMSIYNENVNIYGGRLLRLLVNLSKGKEQQQGVNKVAFSNPISSMMQQYAKSLLVLDAIPLVLNLAPLSVLEIDVEELYEATLNLYSHNCLETSASEFEANELHEGVKKSIATRILGIEHNSAQDEAMEEHVIMTINLISQKFIENLPEDEDKAQLEKLHTLIKDKQDSNQKFDQILSLIHQLSLDDEIPDSILFASSRDDQSSSQAVSSTPPPKVRGRPKKQAQQTVIVTPDDVIKKQLQSKSREVQFTFFSILRYMFTICANYLKRTRSRIFINFNNPLLAHLEQELAKSSSLRSSRSKAGSQPIASEISASSAKRPRLEDPSDPLNHDFKIDPSPLNSEHSRIVDSRLLQSLIESFKCLEFLTSNYGSFTKLWTKFLDSTGLTALKWYRRISVDSMIFSEKYTEMHRFLDADNEKESDDDVEIKTEQSESGTSTLTINPSCRQANVSELRDIAQLISCYVQLADKGKTLSKIDELVSRMKQCGLLGNDESYSNGNIIQEYMIIVKQDDKCKLGFLFFDTLSILRYIVGILMDILKKYIAVVNLTTDAAIGHTIVLSQFDWPKEAPVCSQCISWLRTQKPKSTTPQCLSSATKFTYPDFFHYVLNPNILEDFMAMLCHGYTLDIKSSSPTGFAAPTSSQTRDKSSSSRGSSGATSRSKAITTRGVNKTFKEDLKVALISQMRNSAVLIPLDLISDFIQNSLIPFYNN